MVIRRRSICPLRAGLRQGRSALGFAETPAALMGSVFVVAPDPLVEILLQLGDRAVDALAERHPVELVQHCFVEALDAGRGAAHPDHSAPGLGSRFSLMTPSVRSSVDYCKFLDRHEAFLASGCTAKADVCPRSPEELELANIMVLAAMNAGTASTFLPFSSRQ